MNLYMMEATTDKGHSTHRFGFYEEDDKESRNKTVERIGKELVKTYGGKVTQSGWTSVTGMLQGWGYNVAITKKKARDLDVLDAFFSKVKV